MAEEFGFIADSPASVDEFGFVPDTPTVPRGTITFTGFTPEQEVLAQKFIRARQQPALNKVGTAVGGLVEALWNPVASIGRGIGAIPEIAADPSRLIPTGLEAGRRVGMDVISLADTLNQLTGSPSALDPSAQAPEFSLLNAIKAGIPGLGLAESLRQGVAGLAPRTPSESEVQQFVEAAPFGQAVAEERQKVAFEGAQPEFAEALTQIVELAPPLKGAQLLKGGLNVAKAPISRLAREAVKISNPKVAATFEKAAASEMDQIFDRNPNAHIMANTPMEGWATEAKGAFTETGERLSELRSLSGTPMNAGDQLATKIEARADALEAAGQPKSVIDGMNVRAAEVRGRMTNINSLQEGVTIANRKFSSTPKTTADQFVDEIISKEGGELINQEFKAIAGPEGETVRKQWSNLKIINENIEARVNKLINNAPPEAQPALLQALSSPVGAAGVFAMTNGWTLPGAIAVVGKTISNWAKNEAKALKNSNSIVTAMYNRMAADPLRKTRVGQVAPITPSTPTVAPSVPVSPAVAAPTTIQPPLPPQQVLQQAISQINAGQPTVFPARPTQGRPTVVPGVGELYKDFTPQQLYSEMIKLDMAGGAANKAEALKIQAYLRSQFGL